jgi:Tfp pilus assembly protein PilZ
MPPAGQPVRLKVSYKSPQALLAELTKSVGRGGARIPSDKPLPVGTRFIFELRSVGLKQAVEVGGTVISVSPAGGGKLWLHVKYEPPTDRTGIDAVLKQIASNSAYDKQRKHPRVPMHVRVVEARDNAPDYRLRDLSRGGAGIDVESPQLPAHARVGAAIALELKLTTGPLKLAAEVVWALPGDAKATARFGVRFTQLPASAAATLDKVLALQVLPAPPWIAKITFH